MAESSHEPYLQDLLAKGMATEEEVAEARRLLAEAAAQGRLLSVSEALMQAGARAAHVHHALAVPPPSAAAAQVEDSAADAMASSDLQVLSKIGRGSQPVVIKSRQNSMDSIVADKILLASAARDPEARRRFIREARHAAQLMHPNIVTIHQIAPFRLLGRRAANGGSEGEPLETFYIVMEYVDGGSVADLLAVRKRFDLMEATCIIRSAAEGLAYAHKRGVIHRDIKPGNILLTQGGIVKLADLGLALHVSAAAEAGQVGKAYGTPYYISPEQVRGDPDIDVRTDLYSLGATFYQMVAGVPPFTAPTPQEVMRQHLTALVPDPRQYVPDLPGAVCWLLTRAMAKDREYRYASAEDFIRALDELFAPAGGGKPDRDREAADALGRAEAAASAVDGGGPAPLAATEPTVPAPEALAAQIASIPVSERRRASRVEALAEKAQKSGEARPAAGPGRSREAAGTARQGQSSGALAARGSGPAVRAADARKTRKRNVLLVCIFAVLVLAALVVGGLVLYLNLAGTGGGDLASARQTPAVRLAAPPVPPSPPPVGAEHPAAAGVDQAHPPKVEKAPEAPAPAPPAPPPPAPPESIKEPVAPPAPPKEEKTEPPPPPPPPARLEPEKPAPPAPAAPETITVKAVDAKIHGSDAKYEKGPDRDNIGFWSNKDTYVTWEATVQHSTYEVEITYAKDATNRGNVYAIEIAGRTLRGEVKGTGGWGTFLTRPAGTVKIEKAGTITITVRPVSLAAKSSGLMNLQAITLKPTGP
ncbi:MAG: protein kinase [Planctomycetota bacterium]|nr:protein kinase [Planctomycetota bacterium]